MARRQTASKPGKRTGDLAGLGMASLAPSLAPGLTPGRDRPAAERAATAQACKLAEAGTLPRRGADGHQASLWRRADGGILLTLRLFRRGQPVSGGCEALAFANIEQAIRWLEAYDPLRDLQPAFDALDPSMSLVDLTLRTAALRHRTEKLLIDWRAMLGELLFALPQRA
ncbi:hypothetical protein [Roseomonas sp. USHLN139]|uniref:hypothetical protein n=1 Tax=Roseomonas sp. USHLN139 TaxID=3081298 RepID=UPI003B02E396